MNRKTLENAWKKHREKWSKHRKSSILMNVPVLVRNRARNKSVTIRAVRDKKNTNAKRIEIPVLVIIITVRAR